MRSILVLVALLLLCAPARAAECRVEPTARGRAQCLRHMADIAHARLDALIAGATADMSAATGPELRQFEAALRAEQARWRDAADATCRGAGTPVAVEECRLAATRERLLTVRAQLAAARERLGLAPPLEMPDEVEILVPLPSPPGGPPARTRLPFSVPVTTD